MHVCWVERIIGVWIVFLIFMLILAGNSDGNAGAFIPRLFTQQGISFLLIVIVLPWALLRFSDIVIGGPRRRQLRYVYPPRHF